jgi:hypothetical protein
MLGWLLLDESVRNPGRLVAIGVVAAFAIATGYGIYRLLWQTFFRRARLLSDGDRVIVDYPLLLKRPLEMSDNEIKAVSAVTPDSPGWWDPRSFSLEIEERGIERIAGNRDTQQALDWLTSFQLPLLSHDRRVPPNIAILFDERIDLRSYLRRGWLHRNVGKSRAGERYWSSGFLLSAKDPQAAALTLQRVGVERKLTLDDFASVEPDRDDAKRFRRGMVFRYALTAWGVILVADRIWDFIRA